MIAKFKKNKRQKETGNFFTIVFLTFTIVAVSGLFFLNWKVFQKRAELNNKITALQEEIAKLEKEKERYESRILEIGTEEYWEKELRESFSYKKQGEQVVGFVFPEEDLLDEEIPAAGSSFGETIKGLFGKIKQMVGKMSEPFTKK